MILKISILDASFLLAYKDAGGASAIPLALSPSGSAPLPHVRAQIYSYKHLLRTLSQEAVSGMVRIVTLLYNVF